MIELEKRKVTPHVAMRGGPVGGKGRRDKKDRPLIAARKCMLRRQKRDVGYEISQRCRKKIEEGFGWLKEVARLGRTRLVGRWKLNPQLEIAAAAYNLVRMRKLLIKSEG